MDSKEQFAHGVEFNLAIEVREVGIFFDRNLKWLKLFQGADWCLPEFTMWLTPKKWIEKLETKNWIESSQNDVEMLRHDLFFVVAIGLRGNESWEKQRLDGTYA